MVAVLSKTAKVGNMGRKVMAHGHLHPRGGQEARHVG